MYDDLVDRLRSMPDVFYEYDAEKSSFILQAADRIEQLTGELDKAVKLGKAGGYKATPEHSWAEWCNELYCDLKKADGRIEQLEAALTPSGNTKAAYHGEFSFLITVRVEDEETGKLIDVERKIMVPWSTIKEIMAAIRARAALEGKDD